MVQAHELPNHARNLRENMLGEVMSNLEESCIGRDPEATVEDCMEAVITALIDSGFHVVDRHGDRLLSLEQYARKHGME